MKRGGRFISIHVNLVNRFPPDSLRQNEAESSGLVEVGGHIWYDMPVVVFDPYVGEGRIQNLEIVIFKLAQENVE